MFRPVKIRHYLGAMRSRGFDALAVLKGSGIDPDRLSDSNYLVDFQQSCAVVHNMIRLTGSYSIGFDLGRDSQLADLGIVGHAMLSCRNCRESCAIWARYSNALVGMLVNMTLDEERPDYYTLKLTESVPIGLVFRFCVEELLTIICRIGGALADEVPHVAKLQLSYSAPEHAALYEQYFHCQPEFNAPQTLITFISPSLDRSIRGTDEEFNQICLGHCSHILRQIAAESPLIARLRSMFLARRGSFPSLREAATELGMSDRTLRRRLEDEGHSFLQLVNEFRFDLAKAYLASSHITDKEVAYLIGFKTADAFRHAFKAKTGQSVGAYRRNGALGSTLT